MLNLAVFASGSGSNAASIADYFKDHPKVSVALIVSNNPSAGVIQKAKLRDIPVLIIKNNQLPTNYFLEELYRKQIYCIVLAGFLRLIPDALIAHCPDKILNIHPALLPKYGGKGMYGMNVHQAVAKSKDPETGLTIHLVNHQYDKGRILFQKKIQIKPGETAEDIAQKVLNLEHIHYPKVIEEFLSKH